MSMTIHSALSALKMLDKQITRSINNFNPVTQTIKNETPEGIKSPDEFEKEVTSQLQSIKALIDRKRLIKEAVMQSNANTTVEIAGITYTVIQAINRKAQIELEIGLKRQLQRCYNEELAKLNTHNEQITQKARDLAITAMGEDSKADASGITEAYVNNHKAILLDPLNVSTLVEQMNTEQEEFLAEVDSVLSTSNAITTIDVE